MYIYMIPTQCASASHLLHYVYSQYYVDAVLCLHSIDLLCTCGLVGVPTHITNMSISKLCFLHLLLLEPTLTLSNVTEAVKLVEDSKWDTWGLPLFLNIPLSKSREMMSRYRDVSQRKRAFLKHFLENHPCPTWKLIANAVYYEGEYGALEVIQRDYFKGE